MRALRGFLIKPRKRIWGRFGFVDAFSENWYSRTYLAINQGPIVAMIENYRSGLLWNLLMSAPEVRLGLTRLGFTSPHLNDGLPQAGRPKRIGTSELFVGVGKVSAKQKAASRFGSAPGSVLIREARHGRSCGGLD